ncbi:hypothetical protein SALBM217S_01812 [Streptomyces griseoloalbus]
MLATPGFVEAVPGAARLTGGRGKPAALYRAGTAAALHPPLLRPVPEGRPRMTTTAVTKRAATGALTGLALGDALGFPTEFKDVPSILATYGDWRDLDLPKPAIVTDDTQMTLALGRGLRTAMDRGTLGPKRLERPVREEFVEWWRSPENNRAPGNTCLKACQLLSRDDRPWQDASQAPKPQNRGLGASEHAPGGRPRRTRRHRPNSARARPMTAAVHARPRLTSARPPAPAPRTPYAADQAPANRAARPP